MKKLILIATVLCFAYTAQAKVTYKNTALNETHLNTIKGLLYDMTHSEEATSETNRAKTQRLVPEYSKAIVWLTNCYNSSRTYSLENIHSEESKLIRNMITTITDVLQGRYAGFPAEKAIYRWTEVGTRVIAEYEVNPSNTVPQVTFRLDLRPEESNTRNLVYKHQAEVVEIIQQ